MRAPTPLTDCRILAVDDDDDSLQLAAFVLSSAGALVTEARSKREALKVDAPPDVIVTDVTLDDGDGVELIAELRVRFAACIPAVVVTGWARDVDRERVARIASATHVAKPITVDAFVDAVALAWASRIGAPR